MRHFYISRPRSVPAVGVIFSERRINVAGTIRKRDIRRLYHQIRKRSTFRFRGQDFRIGNSELELPSFSQLRYAVQNIWPNTIGFLTKAWNSLNSFRVWIAKKMYQKLPQSMRKIVKKKCPYQRNQRKKFISE